jgi:hypothetical protein
MTMQEIAHSTHPHTLYRADLLPFEMEDAALAAATSSRCTALLFEKTSNLMADREAGDRDERTWVWNGRTWVWNGARLQESRTWVWNGKGMEFSGFHLEAAGNRYSPWNREGRLL